MSGKHSFKLAHLSQQVAALSALLSKNGISLPAAVKRPKGKKKLVQSNSVVQGIAQVTPAGKGQLTQDPSASSSSNWTTVKSSAAKKLGKEPADLLQAEGWNVPVVRVCVVEDVKTSTCGVSLVSMAVGRHLVCHGVRVDVSLGLLLPAPVPGKEEQAVLMSVLVQDKYGKPQVRQRYLYQLGPEPVVMENMAPKVDIVCDTAKALLIVDQKHVTAEVWKAVQARATPAARTWMKNRVGVSVLDVHPPTRLKDYPNSLQMVVQVGSIQDQTKLLAASGLDGIWTKMFITGPSDRERFKIVPLPYGVTFPEARDKAIFLGDLSAGAVPCGRGFGIRVLASNFDQVLHKMRPSDAEQFLGTQWEISGLPCSCGENALLQLLEGWRFHPVFTFRVGQGLRATRTWIVRSMQEPSVKILQHQFGLALIKEYVRTPQDKKPVQVMRSRPQISSKSTPLPSSWAAVVASGTTTGVVDGRHAAKQSLKRDAPSTPVSTCMSVDAVVVAPTVAAAFGAMPSACAPVLSLQEQIAQAIAVALQPVTALSAQVRTLQEEITAMRAPADAPEEGMDDAEIVAVSYPSAVPPPSASQSARVAGAPY